VRGGESGSVRVQPVNRQARRLAREVRARAATSQPHGAPDDGMRVVGLKGMSDVEK
jgi:hypothetical protein